MVVIKHHVRRKAGKLRTSHEQMTHKWHIRRITHRRQGAPIWRWVPCRTDISGGVGLLRADATEVPRNMAVDATSSGRGRKSEPWHQLDLETCVVTRQSVIRPPDDILRSLESHARCCTSNQTTVTIFSELFDPPTEHDLNIHRVYGLL